MTIQFNLKCQQLEYVIKYIFIYIKSEDKDYKSEDKD